MTTEEMRELDKWICEHILGWFWVNGYRHNYLVPKGAEGRFTDRPGLGWKAGRDETFPDGSISETFSMYNYPLPKPTTDPATAMMVLKKCMERVVVTCAGPREGDNLWYVCQDFRGDNESGETAPTLELAIAKFSRQLFAK